MIASNQPKCFPKDVLVAVSSKNDGTMLDRTIGIHDPSSVGNRTRFCQQVGIDYDDVVYQRIIYDESRTYELIAEVDAGSTTKWTSEVVADGLFTRSPGVGLFLPVADCIATVIYDPKLKLLALLHLGRHSTLTSLLPRMIDKFIGEGSKPEDLLVWMSPSVQASDYKMDYFDQADDQDWQDFCIKQDDGYCLDMQGYNRATCLKKGLSSDNIHISPVNTATNSDYFSHFSGDKSGRFAVVVMML